MEHLVQNVTTTAIQHGGQMVQKRFVSIAAFLLRMLVFVTMVSVGEYMSGPMHFLNGNSKTPVYTTAVRVYAGSHPTKGEAWSLGGDTPDVSLWTEGGFKIGHALGYHRNVAQGAFVDTFVPHHPKIQNARPHYLSLTAAGKDGICISGIEVTYPDGQGVTITGDILKRCALAGTKVNGKDIPLNMDSKTQMGFENSPPACFLLDGDKSYPHLWMTGVTFRLPDYHPTDEKAKAWSENPEHLCGPSPRLFFREGKANVHTPVPVWDPPFELNPDGTDKDPQRVLDWDKLSKKDKKFSLHGRDVNNYQQHSNATNGPNKRSADEQHEALTIDAVPIPNQPRRLIVSHRANFSALEQCHRGNNVGDDYVSMRERVYCDMKKNNMWHLCSRSYTQGCFDTKLNTLRGFDDGTSHLKVDTDDGNGSVSKRDTLAASSRNMTLEHLARPLANTSFSGALYGMRYAHVQVLK